MEPATSLLLWILAVVLGTAGVAGLVLPGLPGAPLLFAALLVAAWAEEFAYVGWRTLALLGLMAGFTYVLDLMATALGARGFGATWRGIAGAALGALIGVFWAPIGILLGPFLGAILGELTARRTLREASAAGLGATIGLVLGVPLKVGVAMMMVGVFLFVRIQGAF
jgi:hypothetical protein